MSRPRRRPLDAEIVRRGLLPPREHAHAAIGAGSVLVGGAPATNPDRRVDAAEAVHVLAPPPRYVSRGGEKLHAALAAFALDPSGRTALDVGASTGGFTDCLLAHGADRVVAVDVGRAQLHERLRTDPRVTVRERTDIRRWTPSTDDPAPSLVTVDVSFISLRTVLPALLAAAAPGADLVLLVKPQFEAPREVVSRGRGVIRDPEEWAGALTRVASALVEVRAAIMAVMASPLRGADGNVEFLLHARTPVDGGGVADGLTPDEVAAAAASVGEVPS